MRIEALETCYRRFYRNLTLPFWHCFPILHSLPPLSNQILFLSLVKRKPLSEHLRFGPGIDSALGLLLKPIQLIVT